MLAEKNNWSPKPYKELSIGVAKETVHGEKRVGLSPQAAETLINAGWNVVVEKGAGQASAYADDTYKSIGAKIVSRNDAWNADIIVKVQPPSLREVKQIGNRTVVSFMVPDLNKLVLDALEKQGATAFGMDCAPKLLTRAQAFDALASQVCGTLESRNQVINI